MSGVAEAGAGELTARFRFPAGFIGFQGHFPESPVLPAVCEIQAALALLQAWSGKRVRLSEVVSAKFLAATTCDEEIEVRCSVTLEEESRGTVKAAVERSSESVARFKLRVSFENGRRGCA